ncbi:RimK/LysX family protein [Haloferacaceae archaeon DSL9]
MRSPDTTRVGVLSFHDSKETKAICSAVASLGGEPVWLNRDTLCVEFGTDQVFVEPPVDVVVNRLLLSNVEEPLEGIGLVDALSQCVPVLNAAPAMARGIHKLATIAAASTHGISVPHTRLAPRHDRLTEPSPAYTDPVAYKTTIGTHGLGVMKARLSTGVDPAYGTQQTLIQELIDPGNTRHWDRRIYVVGGEVVAAMDRTAPPHDWRTNIARGAGSADATAEISPELAEMARRATNLIGLDYAGVDVITDGTDWYLLEVNPTAGFKGLFEASGRSPAPYIAALALETAGESVDEASVAELASRFDTNAPIPSPSATQTQRVRTVGYIERVTVSGAAGSNTVFAKVDTGAKRTSIDYRLAAAVGAGPVTGTVQVRTGASRAAQLRPVLRVTVGVRGDEHVVNAGLENRGRMRYPLLLGRDVVGDYDVDVTRRADQLEE